MEREQEKERTRERKETFLKESFVRSYDVVTDIITNGAKISGGGGARENAQYNMPNTFTHTHTHTHTGTSKQ
jgi:hypothetical protein